MRAEIFISDVQRLLGDPTGQFHTTENMLTYLNMALEDICTRSRTLCTWLYLPVVNGQGHYGLPENFLEFRYVGFFYNGFLYPLNPGGTADTAPSVFSDRQNYNMPYTYSEAGNAYVEKIVGTVVETTTASEEIYRGLPVPQDATDAELGDYVLDIFTEKGAFLGVIQDYLSEAQSETGVFFVLATQGFQSIPDLVLTNDFTTTNGNLTGYFLGSTTESELHTFWTEDGPYNPNTAYYYYDTLYKDLRLVQRTSRTHEAYVGNPRTNLAVNITDAQYQSILIGDRIVNYTDNSEGNITDKSRYSERTAILHFDQLYDGEDNLMELGDEFRITSRTEHRHTIALAPSPTKDDAAGEESLYIYLARTHAPITQEHIDNHNDEIELGTEFNSTLRYQIMYYASLEDKGIDHAQTIGFDVKYNTDYMKAFPKAQRRIREYLSAWRGRTHRLPNRRLITNLADWSVSPIVVR